MMQRLSNWPSKLDAFLASRRLVPFAYGSNDCVLFALDAVLAITGTDLAEPFRGKYKTLRGAQGVMTRYAGTLEDCAARLASTSGLRPIAVGFAQRGDVGYAIDPGFGPTILVRGTDSWFGPGKTGTERSAATLARAWAVARPT